MINMETEGDVQVPSLHPFIKHWKKLRKTLGETQAWMPYDRSLPEVKTTEFSSHFMETKDKAALFKGYQACLFSSRVGGSFYIVDYRNAAWRNVPVKLPECNALNTEYIKHHIHVMSVF